jgi:hypothetical protein
MIGVTRCSWAAGLMLILTAHCAAGDSLGVAINSDRTTARPPREELSGQDPGRLETRRPYERARSLSSLSMVSGAARETGTG